MNLNEICQQIKSIISQIFVAKQELQEATDTSYLKAQEAVIALREAVKEIAPIQTEYQGASSIFWENKIYVFWHKEHGLIMRSKPDQNEPFEPLAIAEGDYPVERLVKVVQLNLNMTLSTITQRRNQARYRTEKLESLIESLKAIQSDLQVS